MLVAHAPGVVAAYDSVSGEERWRRASNEAVHGGEVPVFLGNGVPVAADAASWKLRRRAAELLSRLLAADGDGTMPQTKAVQGGSGVAADAWAPYAQDPNLRTPPAPGPQDAPLLERT